MSVTLPYANEKWPMHRILTKPSWGGNTGIWTIEPMADKFSSTNNAFGYEVLSYSRVALPANGNARIRFRFGKIDGRIVAMSETTQQVGVGRAWSSATDTVSIPSLVNKEIRIQAAPRPVIGTDGTMPDPAWRTVWWGQCEFQEVHDWPGGIIPSGEAIYLCNDALFRMSRWPLNKHGLYTTSSAGGYFQQGNLTGHPGYNACGFDGTTRGNLESSGVTFDPTADQGPESGGDGLRNVFMHTWPGAGRVWTDRQAVEHAMNVARPRNEPVFLLSGSTDLFTQPAGSPWPVDEDDTAWDFLNRVIKRQRGRGLAFLDWDDDVATPTGSLAVKITVRPQTLGDITYVEPLAGGLQTTRTMQGATSAGTTVAVDLIGDHRNVAEAYMLGDRNAHRVDYLETRGERIEVLVTLSRWDSRSTEVSLGNRWTTTQAATFAALTPAQRVSEGYRPVYQLYGIPRAWGGSAGDHNGGTIVPIHRVDYLCLDNGAISFAGGPTSFRDDTGESLSPPSEGAAITSPAVLEIMHDLPLLEGYTYTGTTPGRQDAESESGTPSRRPPLVLVRIGDNRYLSGDAIAWPIGIHIDRDGIAMAAPSDAPSGLRVVSDSTIQSLGAAYSNSAIGCTVALRLPQHVRYASYATDSSGALVTSSNIRRRKVITHNNIHLWLASPGAIWDVDSASFNGSTSGYSVKRNACQGSTDNPGILRDDRPALACLHALASEWYLRERRTATWALRACGFLPSFNYADGNGAIGGTITYPVLGQTVTRLLAGGQGNTINTPITSVMYDNEGGVTTWTTDWSELDFFS